MDKYPKIQTVFKRDMSNKGRIIEGEYSLPELEYLKNNEWVFTEKVDGTNIRVKWERGIGRIFGGRTDNAQIPAILITRLEELFSLEKLDNAIKTEAADFLTLYLTPYTVLANSTFSWWAAYLRPDKFVVAPHPWFSSEGWIPQALNIVKFPIYSEDWHLLDLHSGQPVENNFCLERAQISSDLVKLIRGYITA